MLGGGPAVTDQELQDWRRHTQYSGGLSPQDERVVWFWDAVKALSKEARAEVWRFATGRNQVCQKEHFRTRAGGGANEPSDLSAMPWTAAAAGRRGVLSHGDQIYARRSRRGHRRWSTLARADLLPRAAAAPLLVRRGHISSLCLSVIICPSSPSSPSLRPSPSSPSLCFPSPGCLRGTPQHRCCRLSLTHCC